jgi:subtilisin family serine protease
VLNLFFIQRKPLNLNVQRLNTTYNMKKLFFTLQLSFTCFLLIAQPIPNDFILECRMEEAQLFKAISAVMPRHSEIELRLLSEDLGLFGCKVAVDQVETFKSFISGMQGCKILSNNQYLSNRQQPNDDFYSEQWALEFTKIPKIWDVTTGGITFDKREIVVAVLDDGIDVNHEDLMGNIFINSKEIPNDKADNDGNGYIDDYKGYNIDLGNGTAVAQNHGTGVSGIIGAIGNNQLGISGINWKIKILPIFGVNQLDEIIMAYSYVLKMKRLYLSSKGEKGAFVVVTNYSGGISKAWGDVEPYKQWCAMYDLLGAEGILSVGATDNEPVNVDVIGDMPSTCTSPYFISTTNLDKSGKKVFRAGFGTKYIAMAAPGEQIYTLAKNNGYVKEFSGTSAASPMVAGTIALLFSTPCEAFSDLITHDKAAAALAVRDAILMGSTKTTELKDQTRTGGYLNGEAALALMDTPCDGKLLLPSPKGELAILSLNKVGSELVVEYITPDESAYDLIISNTIGQVYYRTALNVPAFGDKVLNLDQNKLPSGIYIITIANKKGAASRLVFSR